MQQATHKEIKRFVKYLSKMTLIEFIGVAQMLCIPFTEDKDIEKPREFEEVFSEMYDQFIQLKPAVRVDILDVMKKTVKGK